MEEYKVLSQELKAAARGGNFSRKYRAIKNRENTFRKVIFQLSQNVIILEYHYRNLEESYKFQGGNIILQYSKLVGACASVVLTLLWILHCILYIIPKMVFNNQIDLFLNNMLNATKEIPLVGIVLYSIFVFYLMACTMKGNAKVGMRLVFFTIHPLV